MKIYDVFDTLDLECPIKLATFYDVNACNLFLEIANDGWREQYYDENGTDWDLSRERYII